MKLFEQRMVDLLKLGRDHYGVIGVKAEFEAEGTRPDGFLRLLEIARRAQVEVALKIGGCEAVSDLLASKSYGVDYVVAPMIETPYALSKFIDAKNKTYAAVDQLQTNFLFNLETDMALSNLTDLVRAASDEIDGIVFGRVDFTLSRGLSREAINDRPTTDAVLEVATACAVADLEFVVGGSVSTEAIEVLREIRTIRLDRFETRKVIFDGSAIEKTNIERAIVTAVEFELAWLKNKRDDYSQIAIEDVGRIQMMEARLRASPIREIHASATGA